jgi:hypothetical protein
MVEIGILTTLAFTAFPYRRVQKAKEIKSEETGIPVERLEAHHIKPLNLGGTDDMANCSIVSLPEHALEHYVIGMSRRGKAHNQNMMAVRTIVGRMTEPELETFNGMIRDLGR